MSDAPLMPKATAVWLIENTGLTFDQIADFCRLHPLEVKGIADGDVAQGIPPTRLAAAGFAEFNPMEEGDTEEAYRRNRRIELKLTQS